MQTVVFKAVTAAEKSAARDIDRPTKVITQPGFNKGAIRGRFPSKADVKRGFERSSGASAEAAVFIVGKGLRNTKALDLVDELHPIVFGGITTRVPESSRIAGIVTPTKVLLDGLSGKGRLKQLNEFGNIDKFKNGILKKLKDNERLYLNVPLGNTDRKTKHLKPGLYFKGRELVGKDSPEPKGRTRLVHSNARRRASSRRRSSSKIIRTFLIRLLSYKRIRRNKAIWKYPQAVTKVYEKEYASEFIFQYQRAVRKALSD